MSGNCIVAMYHYVRDTATTAFPRINALQPSDFDAQLGALAASRDIVDFPAFDRAIATRRPFDRPAALLTFDDGFCDHYDTVFPRLRDLRLSGVFFLAGATLGDGARVLNVHKTHFLIDALGAERFAAAVLEKATAQSAAAAVELARRSEVYRYDGTTQEADIKHALNYELPAGVATRVLSELFVEHIGDESAFARTLYLSDDQIRAMARAGMTFGFHTEDHPVLSRLSTDDQRAQVRAGVEKVRRLTGQTRVPFCFPYGHAHTYTAETLTILRESGYTLAFGTTRRACDPAVDEPFALPRYDTRDLPPFTAAIPHA
jgi:peptidoglycan/xylan/chitin deacetylase (PgdA/CDA1 family)